MDNPSSLKYYTIFKLNTVSFTLLIGVPDLQFYKDIFTGQPCLYPVSQYQATLKTEDLQGGKKKRNK